MSTTDDTLRQSLAEHGHEFQAVRTSYNSVRARLREVIVEALRAGIPQKDIVGATGYTREAVRQIARAEGIEPT
ncbi:hypothetical protein WY02_03620 [Pseudonocardia sp. AL041005-10]|nr:hypothetical protein [Pseudonocardia sp. AL041005-10]ALE77686.1 hypothetical protein WY02_03620 [Pseudonocardia sp. AL041005-10]